MAGSRILIDELEYSPDTGEFRWAVARGNRRAGAAGNIDPTTGYRRIHFQGRLHLAHRLAWYFLHGTLPKHRIDHINQNKLDNRAANLRDVPNAINVRNAPRRRDNTSGHKGVQWDSGLQRWRAVLVIDGKRVLRRAFKCPEQAAACYRAAVEAYGLAYDNTGPEGQA